MAAFLCNGNEERISAMKDVKNKVPDGGSAESPANAGATEVATESATDGATESATDGATESATDGATEPGAGAAQPDYTMLMQMMQEMKENQTRLAGQIAKISDAQSAIIDAGAVIHEDGSRRPGLVDDTPDDDEFVPIERLDLSI